MHRHNLVVHESDLPRGRGWSPVAWQVLDGQNEIPIVLFEAVPAVDAGEVYLRDLIELDGTELLDEIRQKQGQKTLELVLKFLMEWPDLQPLKQHGEPTYYRRRMEDDDEIDVQGSLADSFDHLRVVDNEKYPAWFEHRGRRFILKIYPKR